MNRLKVKDLLVGAACVLGLVMLAVLALRKENVNVTVNVPEINPKLGAFVSPGSNLTDLRVTNEILVEELLTLRGRAATNTDAIEKWVEVINLGAASSTDSLQQTQSGRVYVRVLGVQLEGTTSATTKFSLGTSTIAEAPDWNVAAASLDGGILDRCSLATGTTGRAAFFTGCNSDGAGLTATSTPWFPIALNEYLNFYRTAGGSNAIQGSSVTSTAGRGWLPTSKLLLEFMRIATSTFSLL